MENLRVDGLEPDCTGCEYKNISKENDRALALYNLACPWGELDYKGIDMAFACHGIRACERKQYLKKIVKIHRMIKEYYSPKS
jgi:hypothetical protein